MRIAILSSWYPSDTNPLYGIFVQSQAEGLSAIHDVNVLLLERSLLSSTKKTTAKQLTIYRKKCIYLPNKNESLLKIWAHQYYLLFKKNHLKNSYDIIHCHDHYGAYAGWYIHEKLGVPYVVTIHNSSIQRMTLVDWKKSYLPKILNTASEVIAVGHKLGVTLESNFTNKKVKVIPNVIDTEVFKPDNKAKSNNPFSFLFIGDLDDNKGVIRLLSAFIKMKNKVSLQIIGRGPLQHEAERFISTHSLEKQVKLNDQLPNSELPSIYNSCHVYISLSQQETFGITILEAMSCGLPVIYTKSGGPEHIVARHGCFETSKSDIEQIAFSMDQLVENYDQINREMIRKHVTDNYSSSSIIGQLTDIYKSYIDEE